MIKKIILQALAIGVAAVCLVSCTFPAKPTGFLKATPKMERDKSTSYQRSWMAPGAELSQYQQIHVASVALHKAKLKNMFANSRLLTGRQKTDLVMNSKILHAEYLKAFSKSTKPWRLIDRPSKAKDAIALELNLVELAPSRPVVELAGKAFTGVGILNRPSMAIEGRIVESRTGKVLAKFADRETPRISALSISKLQYYKSHKNLMRDWAGQTVKWIDRTSSDEKVREIFPLTLIDY